MRMKSDGICNFCKGTVSGTGMTRHLQSCASRMQAQAREKKQGKVFLMKASAGPFWIYFDADGSSTLKKVDSFLRDLWLECCGHLSAFIIGDVHYASQPQQEYGDRSMNVALEKVLTPSLEFIHEYDYGTTTQLSLKCISVRTSKAEGSINILARNNLPEFACVECGKPAKEICSQCEGDGLLCKLCSKKHECGEDMFLPVVNSPRTGVCGYTG